MCLKFQILIACRVVEVDVSNYKMPGAEIGFVNIPLFTRQKYYCQSFMYFMKGNGISPIIPLNPLKWWGILVNGPHYILIEAHIDPSRDRWNEHATWWKWPNSHGVIAHTGNIHSVFWTIINKHIRWSKNDPTEWYQFISVQYPNLHTT